MKNNLSFFLVSLFVIISLPMAAQVEVDKSIQMTGADGDRYISNLELPVAGSHAASKDYVDAAVAATGGSGMFTIGNGSAPTMLSAASSSTLSLLGCINYCRNLVESGYSDWRMPTYMEVLYLLSDDVLYAAIPNPTENKYFYVINDFGNNNYGRLYVNFSNSDIGIDNMYSTSYSARCVR
ncbi:MAG: DUF1566 domain-containing protein [Crocinitomicaceae bacterium]|nr:DUF1566 domain-containing protein [Crocinitomicaceae bacterium]